MSYFLFFFIILSNSILFLLKKKSKIIVLLTLLFMWVLFWGNYLNPDYNNYNSTYLEVSMGEPIFNNLGSEFGFRVLIKIFTILSLDYHVFLAFISILCFILIHSTIRYFAGNSNIVYLFYLIFPFFLDIIQIRNFIAMSIFLYSVKFLFYEKKYSKLKYIIGICVASTIHYSSVFYFPFLLISFKGDSWNKKINILKYLFVLISLLIFANNRTIPYLEPITRFLFDSEKVFNWTQSRTNYGFLLYWTTHFISLGLIRYVKDNLIDESKTNSLITVKQRKSVEFIYMINIVCLIFLPFYFLASSFFRLYRNTILLNYIALSIYNSYTINKKRKIIVKVLMIGYILYLFYFHLWYPLHEDVIQPVMENNYIFN